MRKSEELELFNLLKARSLSEVTLASLAKEMRTSVSTLRRRLRCCGDGGFVRVRAAIRVRVALALLRNDPSIKVDALAWSVGWRTRKALYSAVRRIEGRSLTELRAEARRANTEDTSDDFLIGTA